MSYTSLISQAFNVSPYIVDKALQNIKKENVHLLAVSGKISAGKDTVINQVEQDIGTTFHKEFFAKKLKEEYNQVINIIKESKNKQQAITAIQKEQNVPEFNAQKIVEYIYEEIQENPYLTGYSKTKNLRSGIQFWGTDTRRAQDDKYWVKKTIKPVLYKLAEGVPVSISDVRFLNEADSLKIINAKIVRLDVSPIIQAQRILQRDGTVLSEESINNPSETELDNYKGFTVRINTDDKSPSNISRIIKTIL